MATWIVAAGLAEACFRRGDREAAVRFAERSAKPRPYDPAARQRLEHFQRAEPP